MVESIEPLNPFLLNKYFSSGIVLSEAAQIEWDIEEDLSRVLGDAAAHRLAQAARALRAWTGQAALRLGQGAAEYWTEESPMIASRVKVEAFAREVGELAAAIDALETRIRAVGGRAGEQAR